MNDSSERSLARPSDKQSDRQNVALQNLYIKNLCLDSRQVKPGDLFIALKGLLSDGRDYIPAAIEKGAVAVLVEEDLPKNLPFNIPLIPYSNLRETVGHIADRFFASPSDFLHVIGITGTNGKTSCAHFIAQLMTFLNTPCGVMGTLGAGFIGDLKDFSYTTPDPICTQAELAKLRDQGAKTVAMEVTSHALTQGRVNGVNFYAAIFTNLTRDHLDYHNSMEEYWQAKKCLFNAFDPKYQIINLDDPYGRILWEENHQKSHTHLIGYTTEEISANTKERAMETSSNGIGISEAIEHSGSQNIIRTQHVMLNSEGMSATLHTPWGSGELRCNLLGRFNLSNILAAIAALAVQGFLLSDILKVIPKLTAAKGRMTRLLDTKDPLVVVDFAHTPDALKQVLLALKPHCEGALWCVFGCGGDRDPGKRPMMAHIAETYSDKVVVTQDNPRTENPDQILKDILHGFQDLNKVKVEADRAKAIAYALENAGTGDLVVIAGKGHEQFQIVGTEKIPFDEENVARLAYQKRSQV